MRRRNFISNMALLVPAGLAAPKLIMENGKPATKTVNTSVLVWGAGEASLFVASELKKQGVRVVIVEPSLGKGEDAFYNASIPSVMEQPDKHSKAVYKKISASDYAMVHEEIKNDFKPTSLRRSFTGFVINDGDTEYRASKLIVHAPVDISVAENSIGVRTPGAGIKIISLKKTTFYPRIKYRVLSGTKISRDAITQFTKDKGPVVLGIH
jgi:hypothetical protein